MLPAELIHPLLLLVLNFGGFVAVLLRFVLQDGGPLRRAAWLVLLPVPVTGLLVLAFDGFDPFVRSVFEICTSAQDRGALPPVAALLPDAARLGWMTGLFLMGLAALNWICGHAIVPDEDDDAASAVRAALLARSFRLLAVGFAFMLGSVLVGSFARLSLPVLFMDAGVVFVLFPILATMGVALFRYCRLPIFIEGLWRPVFWGAWGPLVLTVGLFLYVAGSLVADGAGSPQCFGSLGLLGRFFG